MKAFKDKKGFTLIELLAVIVVLAIVMVLAITTVLPLMNSTQENAFILEANNARDAASNVITLININQVGDFNLTEGVDYQVNNDRTKYCFSLKKLAETGLWKKNLDAVTVPEGSPSGTKAEYEGKVIVTSGTNGYTYHIKMHNSNYYVDQDAPAKVDAEGFTTYGSQSDFSCKASDVGE